jgi:hypothetical protein
VNLLRPLSRPTIGQEQLQYGTRFTHHCFSAVQLLKIISLRQPGASVVVTSVDADSTPPRGTMFDHDADCPTAVASYDDEGVAAAIGWPTSVGSGGRPERERETPAMGQLVGGGPAELEQRTDVTDADQPIRGSSGKDGPRIAGGEGFRVGIVMKSTVGNGEQSANNTVRVRHEVTQDERTRRLEGWSMRIGGVTPG